MSEKVFNICDRTLNFAVRIVKFCSFLSQQGIEGKELSRQLIRAGTSVASLQLKIDN